MSYIPDKAMHHAHAPVEPEAEATPATGGGELGPVPDKLVGPSIALGWALGAGAIAIAAAALLSLRGSRAKPAPKRRGRGPAKKPAASRRTTKRAA